MLLNLVFVCLALVPAILAKSDKADIEYVRLNSTTKGTNTYSEAIYYGQTHPTRDGESWNGWCVRKFFFLILADVSFELLFIIFEGALL